MRLSLDGLDGLAATPEELAQINAMYMQFLGRPAEAAGLQNWATASDGGMSLTEIARQIATSQEAQMIQAAQQTYVAPSVQQPVIQTPVVQPPVYQPPAYQAPAVQTLLPAMVNPPMTTAMPSSGISKKTMLIGAIALGGLYYIRKKKRNG